MSTRDIVRKAWQMTQVHLKKLIWYGAVPALFSIVVSGAYLAYQYNAFRKSSLFNNQADAASLVEQAKTVWEWLKISPGLSIALVILAVIFVLGNFFLPPLFRGILIHAVSKIRAYEAIKGSAEAGIRHFFSMFDFSILMGVFSITTLFTESSFILLWWGELAFLRTLPVLLFIAIVGFIISFLFTYAEYFIILQDKPIIKSVMESTVLVASNLRKTFLVFVLMILISVRIILNVVLVLLIPMLIVALGGYFATTVWATLGFVILGIFALAVLLVSAYLFGLFHVFSTAVWVLTFHLLTEKEEPDVKSSSAIAG